MPTPSSNSRPIVRFLPLLAALAAVLPAMLNAFPLAAQQPGTPVADADASAQAVHRIVLLVEQIGASMPLARNAASEDERVRLSKRTAAGLADVRKLALKLQSSIPERTQADAFVSSLRRFEAAVRRQDETLARIVRSEGRRDDAIARLLAATGEARKGVAALVAERRSALRDLREGTAPTAQIWPVLDRLSVLQAAETRLESLAAGFRNLSTARSPSSVARIRAQAADDLRELVRLTVDHGGEPFRAAVSPAVSDVVASLNDPDRSFALAERVFELNREYRDSGLAAGRLAAEVARQGDALAAAIRAETRSAATRDSDDAGATRTMLVAVILVLGVAVIVLAMLCCRQRVGVGGMVSRQTLEEILDAVPQAFVIWGQDGRLVYFNRKYAELRPEMLPYLEKSPTLTEYAKSAFATFKQDATSDEIARNQEWALSEHAEDEQQVASDRWYQRSIRKTPNGWTVFILNDISAHKRNQSRLEQQATELETANERLLALEREASVAQDRLEEAIETIPNGFALWDAEDNLLYLNRRYREQRPDMEPYLDGNPGFAEFARHSIRSRLPNASAEEVEDILQSALDRYAAGQTRDLVLSPAGLWLQMDIRRTGEGGYVVIYSDITELFEARAQLSAAIENMQSGFILWGADDRLILVNEEAQELLPDRLEYLEPGTRLRDFAERSARLRDPDATDEEIASRVDEMVSRRRQSGEPFEVLESTGRWHLVHINPIDSGEAVSVIVDITEQKATQGRLEHQTEELQRSNRELEQFAYLASHDLQEPLRVVSSYCDLINRRYADVLDEDGREFLAYAVDGAQRMRSLIDDLLTYSRTGRGKLSTETFDLRDAVDQASRSLQALIAENEATLEIAELPRVVANNALIAQVFQNLISNGIKFRRDEKPHIRISAERRGADWVVSVSDNGIGIKEEFSERVFRIFQRLHTRDEFAGNGLGLALCQRIVTRHGGRIWVETPDGEGTTISFTILVTPRRMMMPAKKGDEHDD